MKKTMLLAAATLLSATPASAQPACLQFGQIWSFNAPDNKTLIVEDNFHRKFKVSMFGTCIGLTFKENVGFQSRGSMSLSCMSAGDNIVVNQSGLGKQTCPIKSIVAYTPEMQKADEAAAAAKKAGTAPPTQQ